MTFTSSLSQIPTEKKILLELRKIIFGKKVTCPDCGRQMYVQTLVRNKVWRCSKCRNKFSITSLSWLKGMKIPFRHLWCLIWCWQHKININQAKDLTGISLVTVRRYYDLFRDNLKLDNEDIILKDKVQMDEMFVRGGFVIGGKDIRTKKIRLKVFKEKAPNKHHAIDLLFETVKPGSVLCTDGGSIYKGCDKWWPVDHKCDIHSRFEFSITSEIESVWANLRTFIRRMYHHVTLDKLPQIVREFEARFCHQELFDNPLVFLENSLSPVTLAL